MLSSQSVRFLGEQPGLEMGEDGLGAADAESGFLA